MGLRPVADALREQGGHVVAISTDPPERSREVVEHNKLNFPILADVDGHVIAAYGLTHEGGGPGNTTIAVPAIVLCDGDRRILWRRIARRIQDRPDPETLRHVISEHR